MHPGLRRTLTFSVSSALLIASAPACKKDSPPPDTGQTVETSNPGPIKETPPPVDSKPPMVRRTTNPGPVNETPTPPPDPAQADGGADAP